MTHRPKIRPHALAAAAAALLAGPAAQAIAYTWDSGDFTPGVTAPGLLGAGDVLNITSGGNKIFNGSGASFTNAGTVNWLADTLYLQSGAQIVNNGLWNATSDNLLAYNGGAAPAFVNNGVFRKSGGLGSTTLGAGAGFVNNGTLDAASGRIAIVGSTLFNAGSVFSGTGVVDVQSGTNTFAGAFESSSLLLSEGTHLGDGALLGGTVRWAGGHLAGTWTVRAGQTLRAEDGGNKAFDGPGTLIVNQGTLDWASGNTLLMQSGATLRNQALLLASRDTLFAYNGGAAPSLQNQAGGTLRAAAGVTLTVAGVGLSNDGGALDAAAGASIRYVGGSQFNSGTRFTGAGRNVAAGSNQFSGSFDSGNLVLESGAHSGNAALLQGVVAWTGGNLQGGWTIGAGQTLQGIDGGNKAVDGTVTRLDNAGTLDWRSGNPLLLQSGATLSNTGLYRASADHAVLYNGGAQPRFDNSGTVRAAAGHALLFGPGAGLVNSGQLDAEAGASITFGGAARFDAGSRFTGAGVNVGAGDNLWAGSFSSDNLELRSGLHRGSAAVIQGGVNFTGGNLVGDWQVAPGQTLTARDGSNKVFDGNGTVLDNQGTLAWASGNTLLLQSGARIDNRGLALFSTSTTIAYNGGAATTFDNRGTLRAAGGSTLTVGGGAGLVNNAGVLDAQAGAAIVYAGGSVFNAGTQFSGAGRNVAAGNNSFAGSLQSANLELQSGAHAGSAAVVNGGVTWTGGNLAGGWTVAPGQTLAGLPGSNKAIDGIGTTVDNQGRLVWSTGDTLLMQSGARLSNAGTLDIAGDGSILYNGGAAPSFTSAGLVVKSAGGGTSSIGDTLGFDNRGTVDVRSGTLALPSNFGNNGRLQGTGRFAVNGTLSNAGTLAPGAGAGSAPATLGLTGAYAQAATGVFEVDVGSVAGHDLFDIGGAAALDGTLAIHCAGDCSLAVGDVITILDAAGDLSGTFSNVLLGGFQTGAFDVVYDTASDQVRLVVTQAVTAAVPEPGPLTLLGAGLLTLAGLARRRLRA